MVVSLPVLRIPQLRDADELAHLHVAVWKSTYGERLPESCYTQQAVAERKNLWTTILSASPPRLVTAAHQEQIVGFAHAGPPFEQAPAQALELYSLYLLPRWHGSGVGRQLLDAVLGDRPAQLWVAEHNPRAHGFYRRNHFDADGATRQGALPEVRLARQHLPPKNVQDFHSA
ncbi:ribosomal protein S18 acetylase RimI-like enzyme [Rhodococcus sp. 27YEA15]|uniref:GNAT family N-acetyltransferase n=1 Tax=Rhodococcus sp. 27YEA15 TaxID=3156259 RepID=UPI003C797642